MQWSPRRSELRLYVCGFCEVESARGGHGTRRAITARVRIRGDTVVLAEEWRLEIRAGSTSDPVPVELERGGCAGEGGAGRHVPSQRVGVGGVPRVRPSCMEALPIRRVSHTPHRGRTRQSSARRSTRLRPRHVHDWSMCMRDVAYFLRMDPPNSNFEKTIFCILARKVHAKAHGKALHRDYIQHRSCSLELPSSSRVTNRPAPPRKQELTSKIQIQIVVRYRWLIAFLAALWLGRSAAGRRRFAALACDRRGLLRRQFLAAGLGVAAAPARFCAWSVFVIAVSIVCSVELVRVALRSSPRAPMKQKSGGEDNSTHCSKRLGTGREGSRRRVRPRQRGK